MLCIPYITLADALLYMGQVQGQPSHPSPSILTLELPVF